MSAIRFSICSSRSRMDIRNWLSEGEEVREAERRAGSGRCPQHHDWTWAATGEVKTQRPTLSSFPKQHPLTPHSKYGPPRTQSLNQGF